MIVFDIECLKNYFLLAWMGTDGRVATVEIKGKGSTVSKADKTKVSTMLHAGTIVSFNGNGYDLPIITAMLEGYSCTMMYELSQRIITDRIPHWKLYGKDIRELKNLKHIDLIEVAQGQSSLKMYGARIEAKKLWDSPVEWDKSMTKDEMKTLKKYCGNDLQLTMDLYNYLAPQLKIRTKMSKKYNMDLMSKSDAQIAEAVIISEIGGGKKAHIPKGVTYTAPKWVKFATPQLKALKKQICDFQFNIAPTTGKPIQPEWLKNMVIKLGEAQFNVGLGGIHSMESSLTVKSSKKYVMRNADIDSYYPRIIINSQLRPTHLNTKFLSVYEGIVTQRLKAKFKAREAKQKLKELKHELSEL